MTPRTIQEYIQDLKPPLRLFNAFCHEMADKEYGREETRQAYFFYHAGYMSFRSIYLGV
jgi:hypothetical protein